MLMPMDRLNIQTGKWIPYIKQSIEEIQAYLDYQDQLDQEVEAQEEAISYGGRSRARIYSDIRAQLQRDVKKYRFVDGVEVTIYTINCIVYYTIIFYPINLKVNYFKALI